MRAKIGGLIIVGLTAFTSPAIHAIMQEEPSNPAYIVTQDLQQARDFLETGRYAQALPLLEHLVQADPENPDLHNMLGYGHRKLGAFETARPYYLHALALDPNHQGALQYLGELYVQIGDLVNSQAMLARLSSLCTAPPCAARDALQDIIAGKTGW